MKIIPIEGNDIVVGWYPDTKQTTCSIPQREMKKMDEICKFFDKRSRLNNFLSVIDPEGDRVVSLRNIEHFLLKMCHQNNISYSIKKGTVRERFNISENFDKTFDQETKRYFDIFCREKKVVLVYVQIVDGKKMYCYLHTSIGQANLFMWLIKWRTLNYIVNHKDEIEKDIAMYKETTEEKDNDIDDYHHSTTIDPKCSVSIDFTSPSEKKKKKTRVSRKKRSTMLM
jgi:hypothetical protein